MDQEKLSNIIEAARLLKQVLNKVVATEQGIHAETVIAAAARMAGTMLFRSFAPPANQLVPGTPVASDEANRRGPLLMNTLFSVLEQYGHEELDTQTLNGARDTTAASRLSLAATQGALEPWYRKTAETLALDFEEIAMAGAMSTALLVHDCREVLEINRACAIAVHGMVEATKTVPAAFPAAA
jgi:hypothetical protein